MLSVQSVVIALSASYLLVLFIFIIILCSRYILLVPFPGCSRKHRGFEYHIGKLGLQTQWPKQRKFIFPPLWRLYEQGQSAGSLCSLKASLLSLQMAASCSVFMWSSLCVCVYISSWKNFKGLQESTSRKHFKKALQERTRDFPGGPVVKTPLFQCRGGRLDPCLRD